MSEKEREANPSIWLTENLFGSKELILLPVEDFAREMEFLALFCGTVTMPNPPPTDAECDETIRTLIPRDREAYGTEKWVSQYSERQRGIVGYTANKLVQMTRHTDNFQANGEGPRWVLAPHRWQQRMVFCLELGAVPFAWLAFAQPYLFGETIAGQPYSKI